MRHRSFAAPLPLPVDYESPETRHGTVLYLLKVKVAGALKLAGNNVFSGNLLLTFVEGTGTGKRGARLICLPVRWHSRCCTLQPTQRPLMHGFALTLPYLHAGLCLVGNLNSMYELCHTIFSAGYGLSNHVPLGQASHTGTVRRDCPRGETGYGKDVAEQKIDLLLP
jgi:hypothetical protein